MENPRGVKLLKLFWDRAAAVAFAAAGAIMLFAGWFALSDQTDPGDQIPYVMSGGIGGLFLLSIGITLWISADHRDEWQKLDAIDHSLRKLAGDEVPEPAAGVELAVHLEAETVGPAGGLALELERK
jgi:hypothetical protein